MSDNIEKQLQIIGHLQELIQRKSMTYDRTAKEEVAAYYGIPFENVDLPYEQWMTLKSKYMEEVNMSKKTSKMVNVTATIVCPGDNSVGIPDGFIKIDFGDWTSYNAFFACFEDGRKEHREGLREWANKYHENCGTCAVYYGDECFDCGRIGCKGECQPSEDELVEELPN